MTTARPALAGLALAAALLDPRGGAWGAKGAPALAATTADAPSTCASLRAAYAAEVPAAQACRAGQAASCGAVRLRALDDPCRCEVAVNPARTARLDALAARHREAGCPAPAGPCARRCRAPVARCESTGGRAPRCG